MAVSKTKTSKTFGIRSDDLQTLFEKKYYQMPLDLGRIRLSLNLLRQHGYVRGLCDLLSTDIDSGIFGGADDIKRRQRAFGVHIHPQPSFAGFQALFCGNFSDQNLVLLIWAATAYTGISFYNESPAYVEALSIYAGVLLVSVMKAFCDWNKQNQIVKVLGEVDKYSVNVYRQANVDTVSIPFESSLLATQLN